MKRLVGKKSRDYERYKDNREKFLASEIRSLKAEKQKIKDKLKSFCKNEKHNFIVTRDGYGNVFKTCSKCPISIRVRQEDCK